MIKIQKREGYLSLSHIQNQPIGGKKIYKDFLRSTWNSIAKKKKDKFEIWMYIMKHSRL